MLNGAHIEDKCQNFVETISTRLLNVEQKLDKANGEGMESQGFSG